MSNAERITALQTRLTKVQNAIDATLDRNASSYSTEIQQLASLPLSQLRAMDKDIINELARLNRGSRFGAVGFKVVAG